MLLPLSRSADGSSLADFRLGYRSWLDGLRGIAILLVLASHTEPMLLPRGWLGVDLFFVLSGFLITTLLLEEWKATAAISFRLFYARRALRLFPALAAMLVVSAIVMYFVPSVGQQYRSILYALFYVTNWVLAFDLDKVSSTLILTWSLALEEQFYLLWPPLLYAALRFKLRTWRMLVILMALIALVCLHRSILVSDGAAVLRTRYAFDTRADCLLVGCCVGILASYGLLPRSVGLVQLTTGALAILFALYIVGFGDAAGLEGVGLSLVALFFGSVLVLILLNPPRLVMSALSSSALVWIGKLSYSLYLWHLYAAFAIEMSNLDRRLWIVASLPLAFAFAIASHYLIERPFLELKRRYAVVGEVVHLPQTTPAARSGVHSAFKKSNEPA